MRSLAELESPDADEALYRLCQNHSLPDPLATWAGRLLASRTANHPLDEWALRDFSHAADRAYDDALADIMRRGEFS